MPAAYPTSLAHFLTYYDQPPDPPGQPGQKTLVNPDGTTVDLTIDAAAITRQIQEEVVAIEKTVGVQLFQIPGMTAKPATSSKTAPAYPLQGWLSNSIHWMFWNLAFGQVQPGTNIVAPTPPPSHNHMHSKSLALTADDHHQYVPVNGTRGFNGPVTGRTATSSHQLITLAQAQGAGLTAAQVENIIEEELQDSLTDPNFTGLHAMTGPDARRWRMTGGYFYGPTDGNGNIYINFAAAHFGGLASFVYMKMPFPGQSMLGWYNYQYMEDQLILLSLTDQGAWIQFIEDIVVDRSANVSMVWMALGI